VTDRAPRRIPLEPRAWEIGEVAWAIVRNARELNRAGHDRAVRWARAYLGLDS